MKLPNINCIYFDWTGGGKCNKLPRFLKFFKQNCTEIYNLTSETCKLRKLYKKSKFLPSPPPPKK